MVSYVGCVIRVEMKSYLILGFLRTPELCNEQKRKIIFIDNCGDTIPATNRPLGSNIICFKHTAQMIFLLPKVDTHGKVD